MAGASCSSISSSVDRSFVRSSASRGSFFDSRTVFSPSPFRRDLCTFSQRCVNFAFILSTFRHATGKLNIIYFMYAESCIVVSSESHVCSRFTSRKIALHRLEDLDVENETKVHGE